jgi:two-component system cell cycle sensor histidine kinase/response regulator CckA
MIQNQSILIVDDRPANLLALEKTLLPLGVAVQQATCGNDALAATLNHDFALAILDVQMPEMDGFELAGLLRGDERTRSLPIIFLTADFGSEDKLLRAYQAGGVDFIIKPYDERVLLAKVRVFLELDRQRRELALYQQHLEHLVAERTLELRLASDKLHYHAEEAVAAAEEKASIQEHLARSERRFKTFFENAQVGMYRSQIDGGLFLDVNHKLAQILETTKEHLLSQPATGIWAHSPDRDQMIKELEANEGFISNYEITVATGTGGHKPVQLAVRLLPEEGILEGTVVDLTERKQAEALRERLEGQLRQSQKLESLGQLAGGLAHDFNNLLMGILGNADLVLHELGEGHPLAEPLGEIKSAAEISAALTRQLLAFSRKQVINPQVAKVDDLVKDIAQMLGRMVGASIEIQLDLQATDLRAKVDKGQIQTMLVNLAINARDAMPDGGILKISTTEVTLDHGTSCLRTCTEKTRFIDMVVSDTGCGMTEEVLGHAFEPFFTTKREGLGTGLGLATVHGIVSQMGGTVDISSKPGLGTSVFILLPVEDPSVENDKEERRPDPQVGNSEVVLLVDDEDLVRRLVLRVLKKFGYTVLEAHDGAEAIAASKNFSGKIDLLMTDLVMPGMNGRELADKLLEQRPGLAVLFTSGFTADDVMKRGVELEAVDFLGKPYLPADLATKVRSILDRPVRAHSKKRL